MMSVCEKCWGDAYRIMCNTGRSQYDCYLELLAKRKESPCSREEQQGREKKKESGCDCDPLDHSYECQLRNRNPNEYKRQTEGN